MPPPNTPNDASGSSSPTSTRHARRSSEQTTSPIQASSSESLVRDLHTILFAGTPTPTQNSSVSATPPVVTVPSTPLGENSSAQRLPDEMASTRSNMLVPTSPTSSTSPTVSTMPAMAVDTDHSTQGRTNLEGWRPSLHTTSAPRPDLPIEPDFDYVEAVHMSIWSPSRSESPSPVRNTQHVRIQLPFEPSIDWQCLEYISQVDENLICAICKAPFHKPLTTKACGHTFCEACIDQALEEARGRARNRVPCPLCRTELSTGCDRGSNRFVRVVEMGAQLDRLEVKCPNNAQLCKWTGQRSSLEDHVRNVCEYTMLPCLSGSCDKMIIRKSRGDGPVEGQPLCQHYVWSCRHCNEMIDMSTQDQHLLTSCRGYLAPCGYCGTLVVREQLAAHGEACLDEETTCTHEKLGCSLISTRKDLLAHEKVCKFGSVRSFIDEILEEQLKARIGLVKVDLTRQLEQILQRERHCMETSFREIREELREALQGERRQREELALSLSSILRYRGPVSGNATVDDGSHELSRLPLPIPVSSDYEQAEYMFRMFDELDTRMSEISKALIDQDARHSVMLLNELMPVKEQLVEARSQLGVMGMHVRWLMDLQRSRQRQIAEVVSGLTGGSGSGSGSGSAGSATTTGSDVQSDLRQASVGNRDAGRAGGSDDNLPGVLRRVSDRTSPVRPSL